MPDIHEVKPTHLRNWVNSRKDVAADEKKVLAKYIVSHDLIKFGGSLLIGSGTGPMYLVDEIIETQKSSDTPLDLAILTNNLQVFYSMRDAQREHGRIFGDTQVSLTGGRLRTSLDSLIGRAAEEAINSPQFYPDVVFFSAKNITFKGGLRLSYQFEDELPVQEAFASRPTTTRILLADHTKFGVRSTCQAKVTLEDLLRDAKECIVITTSSGQNDRILVEEQEALSDLLKSLASKPEYATKEVVFRVIHSDGRVERELTMGGVRQSLGTNRVGPKEIETRQADVMRR